MWFVIVFFIELVLYIFYISSIFKVHGDFLGNGSSCQDKTEDSEEDLWTLWGQIVNDWANYSVKQNALLKVSMKFI